MFLDFPTTYFFLCVTSLALFCFMLFVDFWAKRTYPGFRTWLASLPTITAGLGLLLLRGVVPDFLSILVANALIMLTYILWVRALLRFRGERLRPLADVTVLVIKVGGLAWFSLVQPDLNARILIASLCGGAYVAWALILMLRPFPFVMHGSRKAASLPALGLALMLTMFALRSVVTAFKLAPEQGLFAPDWSHAVALVGFTLGAILANLGFLMLNWQRKQAEISDLNERLAGLVRDKEVLLQEVHHRVKNNLGEVAGLLALQEGTVEGEEARRALFEAKSRVYTIGHVHDMLCRSKRLDRIGLADYARDIARSLAGSFGGVASVHVDAPEDLHVSMHAAFPLGLILNELLTNSFKYAFTDGPGRIGISARRTANPGRIELVVSDDGAGLPADFDLAAQVPGRGSSLGLSLVTALAEQLGGEIELERGEGARWRITFPE